MQSLMFSQAVRNALAAAAQVGKPESKERLLAIERAVNFAKAKHPNLFK